MASKWRYGCGVRFRIGIACGIGGCKEITVECGSTAYDGGVNQCDSCAKKHPVVTPYEDESDMDWFERQSDYEESNEN